MQDNAQQQNNDGQTWKDILKGLFALLVIAAAAVAALVALVHFTGPVIAAFFSSLSVLDSAIIVALITGSVTVITVVGGGIANNVMKRNEYLRKHREKPYSRLISFFYDFQTQTKLDKEIPQQEVLERFNEFTKELTLWGSSKAVKTWGNWRVKSAEGAQDPEILLFGMEKVLIQLRKDLGLKGRIKKGDLVRLTVNDIDDFLN